MKIPRTHLIHAVDAMERIAETIEKLRSLGIEPDEIRLPTHEAHALALVAADALMPSEEIDLDPARPVGDDRYFHAYTCDDEGQLIPLKP